MIFTKKEKKMKENVRKKGLLVILVVLLAVSYGFAAGQQEQKTGERKVVTIRHMNPHTAGEGGFGDYFADYVKKFNAEHPYINVISDSMSSGDLRTKITVEMASGNPPNTMWLPYSYATEFIKDDLLVDWSKIYSDPAYPEFKERFNDSILYFSETADGKVPMVPYEAHIDGLFYNTAIFEKYGWTVPTTFTELVDLAQKAKKVGIAGTVTGGQDMRFAWLAAALLVRTGGVENAAALCSGNAMEQWNNPAYGFPQAMEKFNELVKAGIYPSGILAISANMADQMFVRGEAATYYEGQFRPGIWEDMGGKEFINKIRRVDFPVMTDMAMGDPTARIGGTIVGLAAASGQSPEEMAASIEWIKAISSPEFWAPVLASGRNLYPGDIEYDKSNVSIVMQQCAEALITAEKLFPSIDTIAPPAVDLAMKSSAMPGLITGQYTVTQAINVVQKAASDYCSKLK
jgi:raffinose/stachyose/melibiose transport system substrate-binding protein